MVLSRMIIVLLCAAGLLGLPSLVEAKNNKFGIHTTSPNLQDIQEAAALVNSQGGEWGYITIVIQENDKDTAKWQKIFNDFRNYKLIPIVRLATKPEPGGFWKRATVDEIPGWVGFLNSLNWVVKERYVILFNEVNHATEWGGSVDPVDYGRVAIQFAKALKESNSDYVVMLAGMDAAAPSSPPNYEDEEKFYKQMVGNAFSKEDFNTYIGGFSSHSYPQDFTGKPLAYGRRTPSTYVWELNMLKALGLNNNLPVFITETGWHNNIKHHDVYLKTAYEKIWLKDERVKAVTPFILNYPEEPFRKFSFKQKNGLYNGAYHIIQAMPKVKGEPPIIHAGEITINNNEPVIRLIAASYYELPVSLVNTGQSIWDSSEGFSFTFACEGIDALVPILNKLEPKRSMATVLRIQTKNVYGQQSCEAGLAKDGKLFVSKKFIATIEKLPNLTIKAQLFPKRKTTGDGFSLEVFDKAENIVFKQNNITIENGISEVKEIHNIIPGEQYRVVLLKKGYLPRQTFVTFNETQETAAFKDMLPLDPSGNGALGLEDILGFLTLRFLGMLTP